MADKSFGVKDINLIGASGTPTIESPNNLNINAINVAISTNATVGGSLDVDGNTELDDLNVSGISTFQDNIVLTGVGKSIQIGPTADQLSLEHDANGLGLIRQNNELFLSSPSIQITNLDGSKVSAIFSPTGEVGLRHNNYTKLQTTASGIDVTGHTETDTLNVSGVSTLGTVKISSGIITAVSGVVTYYGDGSNLTGVTPAGVIEGISVINESGSTVGTASSITTLSFQGSSGVTVTGTTGAAGIATVLISAPGELNDLSDATTSSTSLLLGDSVSTNSTENTVIGQEAGANINYRKNTFVGYQAGKWMTYEQNTAIGNQALGGATGSTSNAFDCVAIGDRALRLIEDNANFNTALGASAGYEVTSGRNNTLIGASAGVAVTTGRDNVCIGVNAGADITSGEDNTCIGTFAGDEITTGSNNIVIGNDAAASSATVSNEITLGSSNITKLRVPGIGLTFSSAGANIAGIVTVGDELHVGYQKEIYFSNNSVYNAFQISQNGSAQSLIKNNVNAGNIVLATGNAGSGYVQITNASGGETAAKFTPGGATELHYDGNKKLETTSSGATVTGTLTATSFVKSGGTSSQYLMADGSVTTSGGGGGGASDINSLSDGRTTALSVGLGTGALANDDGTDNGNVAVGYSALHENITGLYNVAIGKHAMGISTSANVNVFIGRDAGRLVTNASSNVVVGSAAGYNLTSGSNHVFVGRDAGSQVTDGDNNTLVGYFAGGSSTISNSVAIGFNAGDNSSSDKATYVGNMAGYHHDGDENTFIGYRSGESDSGAANIGTGNSNTGAGYYSLNNLTSGSKNTTLGHNTGFGVTDGNSNVFLGYDAGSEQQGSENVIIGSGVTSANSATGDTQLAIGVGNSIWLRGDSSFNLYDKDGNQLNGAGGGGSGISNVVEDTTPQLGGTLETNGNLIRFGDSGGVTDDRLQFGDDQDMLVYFDGTRLKITPANSQNSTQLDFEAKDQVSIASLSNGVFLKASNQNIIDMYGGSGGGIYFHHNNNDKLKLEGGNWTTQGDADWTFSGTNYNIVFDASDDALEFADNAKAKFGAGDDLQIYHDSNNSYISDQGTGNLKVLSSTFVLRNAADNAFMLQAVASGAVKLFHSNTNRLETTGAGVTIAGIATATSFVKTGGTSSQYLMADGSVTTSGGGGGGASEAFKTIAVSGQSDVVADSATDTLTLVAGNNMTITTNASGDSITFASSGGGGGGGGVTTGKAIAMAMIFG